MSWQTDIENIIFTIITGDGKEWRPKWKNATKDVEYNASIYEFVNVDGSLALRAKPKGRRFDLEFYFDGENAVTIGNNFEISARNNKYWTVKHPFYGDIKCQPLSLKQDNTALNVSKFTVPVIETITTAYPEATKIIEDEIIVKVAEINELQQVAYEQSAEIDRTELVKNVSALDTIFSSIIKTSEELKEFKDAVADAVIEITNVVSTGTSILRAIHTLINYPATIEQTIEARFNSFVEALDNIIDTFGDNKEQFEAISGSIVAAMQLVTVSNITDDFNIRKDVIDHQDSLLTEYNKYLSFLDTLQTERADSDDSYTPDYNSQNGLNELVNLTISNLFEVAFSAKQEREFTLEKDSNPILLTHRFYGLDKLDENLSKFIKTNNVGLNELLNIKKGRKIVYYV